MIAELLRAPFQLMRYKSFCLQLLKRNITQRYKGSALGMVWSFVQPLFMLCVYSFVFGIVFKARWGEAALNDSQAAFPLIMFCGMCVFNLFSESVNSSGIIILSNPNFVKKVACPLEALPLVSVVTAAFYNLAWFALLFAGAAIWLETLSWTMLLLPLTVVPLLLLSAGCSMAVAAFGVYIRDIPQFVALLTQVLFFMTPIFYPASMVPPQYAWIMNVNPLTPLVEQTRRLFLYGQQPDYGVCLLMLLFSLFVFYLGFACFMKLKKGFADVI